MDDPNARSNVEDGRSSSSFSEIHRDKEDDALLRESLLSEGHLDDSTPSYCKQHHECSEYTDEDFLWARTRASHPSKRATDTKITVAVFFALCWLLLLVLYLVQPVRPPVSAKIPKLDVSYQPDEHFDLVINMYREDLEVVSSVIDQILSSSPLALNARVFIYVKDEDRREPELRAKLPDSEIIHRPNIGREGETFLYHILNKWDDLARHTLFMQALPDDFDELLQRFRENFVAETGMLSLSFVSTVCDCHMCSDPYWHDYSGALAKTYELANNASCGWLLLSYKGQFIASAARIRGAGRGVYEYLYDALVQEDSWAHNPDYWQPMDIAVDSMNSPVLGFSLERLWFGIMQCSNLQVAARCPTMISNTRRKTKADDCQCLDYEPGINYIGD